MTDHPLDLRPHEVRAALDGRLSLIVRPLEPQPVNATTWTLDMHEGQERCRVFWYRPDGYRAQPMFSPLPFALGDRLWCREAFRLTDGGEYECVVYESDEKDVKDHERGIERIQRECGLSDEWAETHLRKRSADEMPNWASRLTLTVSDVAVKRVQEITNAEAVFQGIERLYEPNGFRDYSSDDPAARLAMRPSFVSQWNAAHGLDAWDRNLWCAFCSVTIHPTNIDMEG